MEKTAQVRVGQIRVGIFGWQYPQFREVLYGPEVPSNQMLRVYAEHFDTVEVNSTFYHFSRPLTGIDCHIYFDTTMDASAVHDARVLQRLLGAGAVAGSIPRRHAA